MIKKKAEQENNGQIQAESTIRTKLWLLYLANYQRELNRGSK